MQVIQAPSEDGVGSDDGSSVVDSASALGRAARESNCSKSGKVRRSHYLGVGGGNGNKYGGHTYSRDDLDLEAGHHHSSSKRAEKKKRWSSEGRANSTAGSEDAEDANLIIRSSVDSLGSMRTDSKDGARGSALAGTNSSGVTPKARDYGRKSHGD